MRLPAKISIALVLSVAAAGCAGKDGGAGGGTVVIATAADAESFLPPFVSTVQAQAVSDNLFDRLADIGPSLNTVGDADFQPRLASRWEWSKDSLNVTFHLDPRARWHDGKPVRAGDVRFALSIFVDPALNSPSGGDLRSAIDSVSIGDSVTCTVWLKQRGPEQFYTITKGLTPLPEHLMKEMPRDSTMRASAFAHAPVGSGPFRFVKWVPRQRTEIAAVDSFYRGRPKLDRVIWTFVPEVTTAVQQLFAGDADFLEALSPGDVAEAAKHPQVRVTLLPAFSYNFLDLNLHDGATERPHPVFGDRAMRRALTMAIDREAMVKSAFDSLATVGLGPFVRAQWSSDTTITRIRFDRAAAGRMLDSLGWRASADGMRSRNGKPLAFSIMVPSSSKNRVRVATLMQEQFRLSGVKVELQTLDFPALLAALNKRSFDAFMGGFNTTPSPSALRQTWSTAAGSKGGPFNPGRYANPRFDAETDSALSAASVAAARPHFHAAYEQIIDDAPAIWLYDYRSPTGAHTRLVTGPLKTNTWWMTIPNWSIAPGGRLPRDVAPAKP
jgi:peptide/nickel transport system substrate-binding protein